MSGDLTYGVPFAGRHIGPSADEQRRMLDTVGYGSVEELMDAAIPEVDPLARHARPAAGGLRGRGAGRAAGAGRPQHGGRSRMIGLGYYGTHTPGVIRRNVLENPAWYTAYTPYQPEISQGRLEALLNFQTMVTDLTGLATANASMLDEGTAAAEAMTLARRSSKATSNVYVVDADTLPQTIAVIATRAEPLGIEVRVVDLDDEAALPAEFFGLHLQYPGASGAVRDHTALVEARPRQGRPGHGRPADLLALCLLRAPGEIGADIAVGSAQRFGVPMGFGGPHAGLPRRAGRAGAVAARAPGRGLQGRRRRPGLPARAADPRAAHPPREGDQQHLHRPGAAGRDGQHVRGLPRPRTGCGASRAAPTGWRRRWRPACAAAGSSVAARGVLRHGHRRSCRAGRPRSSRPRPSAGSTCAWSTPTGSSIACDETTTSEHLRGGAGRRSASPMWTLTQLDVDRGRARRRCARTTEYLTHPVFHAHRSETAMLRYLRSLADKDYALDRGMIPLGSCTMKLNATTEMEPVTWPEFANMHPFAPADADGRVHGAGRRSSRAGWPR